MSDNSINSHNGLRWKMSAETKVTLTAEGHRRYATERHARLIELLGKYGYCAVAELSATLCVSTMTIRRDLHFLASQQIVQVSHGGARLSQQRQSEPDLTVREREHQREKEAIGRRAAALIEAGDVVGLDGGSTVIEVARHLPGVAMTVVTYALPVADALARNDRCRLVMLGGLFHRESWSFTGPQAIAALRSLRIGKLFLAASGLLIPDGLSSSYIYDAEVKQALIESSRQVILCMDSSKIGRVYLAHFAALNRVHVIVTDDAIGEADHAALEGQGVKVIVAAASDPIPAKRPSESSFPKRP